MADQSALTWGELSALVAAGEAIWRGGRPPGRPDAACLTWTEFRAAAAHQGGQDSPALITQAEFRAVRVREVRLLWDTTALPSGASATLRPYSGAAEGILVTLPSGSTGSLGYSPTVTQFSAAVNHLNSIRSVTQAVQAGQTWRVRYTTSSPYVTFTRES